eukprot:4930147-Amphidinium_carterae.1
MITVVIIVRTTWDKPACRHEHRHEVEEHTHRYMQSDAHIDTQTHTLHSRLRSHFPTAFEASMVDDFVGNNY